jgi:dihydrofolate reductase
VPLGEGGEQLHEWVIRLASWRDPHGLEGGETGPDDAVFQESTEATGAVLMGRKMFSGGQGPWEDDSNRDGWWGDDPPFRKPVFILTHHARETVTNANGTIFTFVTDGIESALQQARAAAGDKAVSIGGGADVARQYLAAGLIDEIELHVVPVLLGGGVRLFDRLGGSPPLLELTRVVDSPTVTHLRYGAIR